MKIVQHEKVQHEKSVTQKKQHENCAIRKKSNINIVQHGKRAT